MRAHAHLNLLDCLVKNCQLSCFYATGRVPSLSGLKSLLETYLFSLAFDTVQDVCFLLLKGGIYKIISLLDVMQNKSATLSSITWACPHNPLYLHVLSIVIILEHQLSKRRYNGTFCGHCQMTK